MLSMLCISVECDCDTLASSVSAIFCQQNPKPDPPLSRILMFRLKPNPPVSMYLMTRSLNPPKAPQLYPSSHKRTTRFCSVTVFPESCHVRREIGCVACGLKSLKLNRSINVMSSSSKRTKEAVETQKIASMAKPSIPLARAKKSARPWP